MRDRFVGFAITDVDAGLVGSAPREDAVRAEGPRAEARDLERRAARGHARGPAGRLRVRGESGDRSRALRARRGVVGYPSIVGSGPNATILHYPDGARQMQAGDLLLVDAACNFEYMSGDVTRTYPVSGTFSPAQKDIYDIVLQRAAGRDCRPPSRARRCRTCTAAPSR